MLVPFGKLTKGVSNICKKNFGIFAPALQKANDPIQQLFLDKLREFRSKYKDGSSLPPEVDSEIKKTKEKILSQHQVKSEETLLEFPTFKFPEAKIENTKLGSSDAQE